MHCGAKIGSNDISGSRVQAELSIVTLLIKKNLNLESYNPVNLRDIDCVYRAGFIVGRGLDRRIL